MNIKILQDSLEYTDKWLQHNYDDSRLPGFVVAVQHNDKVLFSKAYGYADLDTKEKLTPSHGFRIASHSKTFTATAIMILLEQGKLRLDDTVHAHLSWFKSTEDPEIAKITIRQLLNHTSGIIRDGDNCDYWQLDYPFPDEQFLKDYIKKAKLVLDRNEQFKYSNFGYSYLGIIIEAVSNVPYKTFVKHSIIDKLKLKNTGPDLDTRAQKILAKGHSSIILGSKRKTLTHIDTNGMSSATGFYATADDMCRYFSSHFLGNEELITDNSKREMQHDYWHPDNSEEGYGYGLDHQTIEGREWLGHGGGFPGFITNTKFSPKDKLVVVALTNAWDGSASAISRGVINIIDYFQNNGQEKPNNAQGINKFTGRFFSQWGVVDIVKVNNSLVSIDPRNWSTFKFAEKLRYKSTDTLIIDQASGYSSPGENITYIFDNKGNPAKINYSGATMYPYEKFRKLRNL